MVVRLLSWFPRRAQRSTMSVDHIGAFFNGLWRYRREHYVVWLRNGAGGRASRVPCPVASYYADPFLVEDGARQWLLVEEYRYARSRARISAIPLEGGRAAGAAVVALDPGSHASFPFTFRHEGALFMLPETSQAGTLDLYACEAMPGRWRLAARLFERVDCADSVLHRLGGLWYLITSAKRDAGASRRWLEIYVSDSPQSGRWQAHPVNRERRYADRDHGYGRNAGALIEADGHLLRPMQASRRRYGEAMQMMQITRLTPEAFEEEPFAGEHPFRDVAGSTHHVSRAGAILAWDERTR
jgi:hypothetical protein